MKNRLLDNILYGNELAELDDGCPPLRRAHQADVPDGDAGDWAEVVALTRRFFRNRRPGVFGGPITAGDAIFIAAFMARVRPVRMIEVGVASGFSSAFILHAARELGLLGEDVFLYSYDIAAKLPDGNVVGQYVERHYAEIAAHWSLNTGITTVDLLTGKAARPDIGAGPALAFIDGEHGHPWPMVDAYCLSHMLPGDAWLLMQDYQVMERWFADTIEFGVPVFAPQRGVNLAVAHWPGEKLIGTRMAYNMAAVRLRDAAAMRAYLDRAADYDDEVCFPHAEAVGLPPSEGAIAVEE